MSLSVDFEAWPKTPRWKDEHIVITEKIDGTNAQLLIDPDTGVFQAGSRTRWVTPEEDNYGFANWAYRNKDALIEGLGRGRHFGEWWGLGIQRGYNMPEKRFSLFNTMRPFDSLPSNIGVSIVPVIYQGPLKDTAIEDAIKRLENEGSIASPGFRNFEGICIFMRNSKQVYKIPLYK